MNQKLFRQYLYSMGEKVKKKFYEILNFIRYWRLIFKFSTFQYMINTQGFF